MTTIIQTGNWLLHAEVTPVILLPSHLHLKLSSQLLTAHDPQAHNTLFSMTATRDGMVALQRAISTALNQEPA